MNLELLDVFGSLGGVVIGRNEGARLRRAIATLQYEVALVVYVDSGSSDDSVAVAKGLGAEVVMLDAASPFTAARARHEGIRRLRELRPEIELVQVMDGDCELDRGWMETAIPILLGAPKAAIVCGRRREQHPEASLWNRLCDIEWRGEPGEVDSCGGDALIRLDAYDHAGGFDGSLIAGEEPELCLRLRRGGWKILRLDCDMTTHDAGMTRFAQWWRRSMRCGHAYAEARAKHGAGPEGFRVGEVRSAIEWGVLLPSLALGLSGLTYGASLLLLGAYHSLFRRVRGHGLAAGLEQREADLWAGSCVVAKFAEAVGIGRYWVGRLRGRPAGIVEYRGAPVQAGALQPGRAA